MNRLSLPANRGGFSRSNAVRARVPTQTASPLTRAVWTSEQAAGRCGERLVPRTAKHAENAKREGGNAANGGRRGLRRRQTQCWKNFRTTSAGVAITGAERSNSCRTRPSCRCSTPRRCSSLESSTRPSRSAVSATRKASLSSAAGRTRASRNRQPIRSTMPCSTGIRLMGTMRQSRAAAIPARAR